MIRRLLLVALALILSWAGVVPPNVVAPSSAAEFVHVYAYDGHHNTAVPRYATTERGPPLAHDQSTAYGAVDLGSHGASARPDGATITYNAPTTLREVARRTGTTKGQAQVADVDLAVFDRGRVAADSGAPLIKAGSEGGETAGKAFSQRVRQQTLDENPNVCVYCRMETDRPQVDHVIPRSRGGNATPENAQTTCWWCNASKGARDFPVNPPPGYEGMWPPTWWGLLR